METEFIKSLNCNYERILLKEKPEERRYQYCILSRGGIKGLLSCSLRYINDEGYLYYDISSKQNLCQLYRTKSITRKWVKDFLWSFQQLRRELERFLLEEKNILWYPEQIFQELERQTFSFLYIPYYEGENGFRQLLDFLVEKIDYEDEILVDCVYRIYERYEQGGEVYLQKGIFEDGKQLDEIKITPAPKETKVKEEIQSRDYREQTSDYSAADTAEQSERGKRSPFVLFERKRKKDKEFRAAYQNNMKEIMQGLAVAEETNYDCEYGKTVYIEETEPEDKRRELKTAEGKTLAIITEDVLVIGKKKGEADAVIEDASVSRLHARVFKENDDYYIEDLNSTNGTYKNGLQLQPYEKRLLNVGDEIRIGRVALSFL